MQTPIVYRDGVIVAAIGAKHKDILYGVSIPTEENTPQMVLTQSQARELRDALTWIISEVDAKHGKHSFKPSER